MNAFPNFQVVIDDVTIHFIHQRGVGPAPMPIVITHGWLWTFWDMQKLIEPLADPASYGGDPSDAFDVVVPSLQSTASPGAAPGRLEFLAHGRAMAPAHDGGARLQKVYRQRRGFGMLRFDGNGIHPGRRETRETPRSSG